MYRIKSILSTIPVLFCLASCRPEGLVNPQLSGFAFASGVLNVEVTDDYEGIVKVPVYRGNESVSSAHVTIQYDTTETGSSKPVWSDVDKRGLFSIVSNKVTFADKSFTAYAQIKYGDIARLGITDKYRMRLIINGMASPSNRDTTVITISRQLTFEKLGICSYSDKCIFDESYKTDIYKAKESEIYRIMDPYKEGLVAEGYAEIGLMGQTPEYIQFACDKNGHITFSEFPTGMLVPTGKGDPCMCYVYYPSDYKWGKDFSRFDAENKKISDKEFQLCGVYCLPDFSYGFLDEGCYVIGIKVQ